MTNKVSLLALILILSMNVNAQNTIFDKNYKLAKKLCDQGIIEQVMNKDSVTKQEADAFLLAEYYKCSLGDVSQREMLKTIQIYSPKTNLSQKNEDKIETEFYKIINKLDKLLHTKDYSYLSNLTNLPF